MSLAHGGLLVLRCGACGHAWVAKRTPLSGGCPECNGGAGIQFKAGSLKIRRFPRLLARRLATLLREGKLDAAWEVVRYEERKGGTG